MKQIELNGKKYKVPENWYEVTLTMQMKVSEDTDKIVLEDLKKFAILSGYANIPIDVLKQANILDLQDLFKAVSFINDELPTKGIVDFEFNGSHYYVGQQLIEMEFQDFISIENVLQENSGHTYNSLPMIIAILAKKKKENGVFESLEDYDVHQRAKEFLQLPLPIAHQLSLFFSASETLYSNLIPSFSKSENQELLMQRQIDLVEILLKELAGKGWLMRCVAGILRYSLKSIKRKLRKHSTSTV